MAAAWGEVLDSLASQLELQERALLHGHPAPADLEIDPPNRPLDEIDRLRAIELFERCEALLDTATERAVAARRRRGASPYGRTT